MARQRDRQASRLSSLVLHSALEFDFHSLVDGPSFDIIIGQLHMLFLELGRKSRLIDLEGSLEVSHQLLNGCHSFRVLMRESLRVIKVPLYSTLNTVTDLLPIHQVLVHSAIEAKPR